MLKELLKEKGYETINDALQNFVSDIADKIDDELRDIIDDVKSGNFSNSEIAERLEELKGMIY